MPIRQDLVQYLADHGIAVLNADDFTGQAQREFALRLQCSCDAEFDLNMDALAARMRQELKSSPCARCARQQPKARAVAEVLERHGARLIEYASCHKVTFLCRCGKEATTESRTIEKPGWCGCPHSRSTKTPWPSVQLAATQAGLELLAVPADFGNQKSPLRVRCLACGVSAEKTYKDMRTGRGCGQCARAKAVDTYAANHPGEQLPQGLASPLQAPAVKQVAREASRAARARPANVGSSAVTRVKNGGPVEAPLARPEVRAVAQQTHTEHHGVATPLQRAEVRALGMAGGTPEFYGSMAHTYGVWHASQHPEIRRKMNRGMFRRRPYTVGPRTVALLGYEAAFLDVALGIKPFRVVVDCATRFVVPPWVVAHAHDGCPLTHAILLDGGASTRAEGPPFVNYIDGGRRHVYYPDAEIPVGPQVPLPIVVEVKSSWTFDLNPRNLFAKARAVLASGKRFEAWVLDRHGTVLDIVSADPQENALRSHATALAWAGEHLAELWGLAEYFPTAATERAELLTMPRTPDSVQSQEYDADLDDATPLPPIGPTRVDNSEPAHHGPGEIDDDDADEPKAKRARPDTNSEPAHRGEIDDYDGADEPKAKRARPYSASPPPPAVASSSESDEDSDASIEFRNREDKETEFDQHPDECGCNWASFAPPGEATVLGDGPESGDRVPIKVRDAIVDDGVRILAVAATDRAPDVIHRRILMRCAHCPVDPTKDFWLTVSQMYTRIRLLDRRAKKLPEGVRNVPILLCYRCRVKYVEAHGITVQRAKVHRVREKILAIGGQVPATQGEFYHPRPSPRVNYTCHCGAEVVGQTARRILKVKAWFGCDACTNARLFALADGVEVSVPQRLDAMRQKMEGLGCTVIAVRREAALNKAPAVTFNCHCGAENICLTEAVVNSERCRGCRSCSGFTREAPKRFRKWGNAAAELAEVLARTGCTLVPPAPVLASDGFEFICACKAQKKTTLQNALRPAWRGCTACNRKKPQ